MKQRKSYECDFCGKLYKRPSNAEKHEKQCKQNPVNARPCLNGCVHLDKVKAEQWTELYGRDVIRKVDVLYCAAKDVYLYPPQSALNGKRPLEDLDKENEAMPKACTLFDGGFLPNWDVKEII